MGFSAVQMYGDKSQPGTFTDTNIRDCRTRKIYPTKWLSYPLLVLLAIFLPIHKVL